MAYPKSMLDVAEKCAEKHKADVSLAAEEAERLMRSLPEFAEAVATLIRNAVKEMVYQARHEQNRRIKNDSGAYVTAPKADYSTAASVSKVYSSIFDYFIAGTTLGALSGASLDAVAKCETAVAEGHFFNARLCMELRMLVPANKTVKDSVSEKKLAAIFSKLKKQEREEAA